MGVFPCAKCGEPWLSFDAGESHVCNALKVSHLELQNRELQKKLAQVIEITQERVTVFTETWNVTHGVGADARLECTTKLLAKFKALIEQPIEKVKCEHDWNQSQFDLMCIKCGVIVAIQDHKTLKPKCACPGLPKHLPGCGTTITVTEAALKRNEGA